MKRLLTIFSAFVLGSGSAFGVASCTTRGKHERDDKDELDHNQDLGILNDIKQELKQTFKAWWNTKATIDINAYPEQISSFTELVKAVETTEESLSLTREEIKNYRFLDQLLTGFQAEFDNLNQMLRNKYSNYYGDTMPLLLDDNNILFKLYHINFDKITKLIKSTPQAILGITLKVTIAYEVRFKGLYGNDTIDNVVVISNNSDVLSNIQENLLAYFLIFIDELFKKQEYKLIYTQEFNFFNISGRDIFYKYIKERLREDNIMFQMSSHLIDLSWWNSLGHSSITLLKENESVLAWAGEGYDPMKLTPENFLEFYKKRYNQIEDGNYLKAQVVAFWWDSTIMIENLAP